MTRPITSPTTKAICKLNQGNHNQQNTQTQYSNPGSYSNHNQQGTQTQGDHNNPVYSNPGFQNQYSNQNQGGYSNPGSQTSNQFQNNGMYTNVTQFSNVNNNYGGYSNLAYSSPGNSGNFGMTQDNFSEMFYRITVAVVPVIPKKTRFLNVIIRRRRPKIEEREEGP
ncbi:hypothetical protein B9Z55_011719 [Caenorhabditis nigoni]|uniref:Uncharacterized protein n=1 Tax=Caenorhabditis nigoni TaxID=1611254 RepID=A0A2G5UL99_9PELO|nr:hypothetical protein B9Z55_011719 [Caenorhabditis nigoni]